MIRFVEELTIIEESVSLQLSISFFHYVFLHVATFLIGTQKLFSNLDTWKTSQMKLLDH